MKQFKPLQAQIKDLPSQPGIYRFYDVRKRLLYVGKAANLKRRIRSYLKKPPDYRLVGLVDKIEKIEYTPTDSILEALILEANEIRKHQPPFNVRLKDDKTFVMIGITKEPFPRVIVTRPTRKEKTPLKEQFGPYTSADQARTALKIIRKILPFRTTCQVTHLGKQTRSVGLGVLSRNVRGCLDYQLGLCPGPCAGNISEKEYSKQVRKVTLFLQGKKNILVRQTKREMEQAAKIEDFEAAARLRRQLFALEHIQDVALLREDRGQRTENGKQSLPKRIEAYDISNILSGYAVGSMVVLTNGQPDKAEYRKFRIRTVEGQNDLAMMDEVLTRRFRHLEWPLPDLVVIDGGEEHLKVGLRVLKKAKLTIPVIAVAKGPERKKLDLFCSNQELMSYVLRLTSTIQLARDEAHRFAITYHRSRRDRDFLLD